MLRIVRIDSDTREATDNIDTIAAICLSMRNSRWTDSLPIARAAAGAAAAALALRVAGRALRPRVLNAVAALAIAAAKAFAAGAPRRAGAAFTLPRFARNPFLGTPNRGCAALGTAIVATRSVVSAGLR